MMRAMIAFAFLICSAPLARAQSPGDATIPVTVQNFARAESDNYLAANVKKAGLGRLAHNREPASIEDPARRSTSGVPVRSPQAFAPRQPLRNRWFVDSPLEGTGFELLVRGRGEAGCRAF